jgi:hypothetical protein
MATDYSKVVLACTTSVLSAGSPHSGALPAPPILIALEFLLASCHRVSSMAPTDWKPVAWANSPPGHCNPAGEACTPQPPGTAGSAGAVCSKSKSKPGMRRPRWPCYR